MSCVGQRAGNTAHRRVLAVAFPVRLERGDDVLCGLTRDLGHLVDFGEAVLVARNAMAADAHLGFLFAGLNVALGVGSHSHGGERRSGDNGTDDRGQQFDSFCKHNEEDD
jgi:hypothetical protein